MATQGLGLHLQKVADDKGVGVHLKKRSGMKGEDV